MGLPINHEPRKPRGERRDQRNLLRGMKPKPAMPAPRLRVIKEQFEPGLCWWVRGQE